MFASVYPQFHELHPNIIVEPVELNVKKQKILINRRELDIGFLTLSDNTHKNDNSYRDILSKNIIVAQFLPIIL